MKNTHLISALFDVQIITYKEGIRLGKVLDVFVNHETKKMTGISFHSKRADLEKEGYFSFPEIHAIGPDAVIVSTETAAAPLPEEVKGFGWKSLKGLTVMTVEGDEIGEIADIYVNKKSGAITDLIFADHKQLGVELDALTIGANAFMVPIDYAARIEDFEPPPPQLKTDVRNVKATVENVVIKAVKKIEKTVDKVFHKAGVDPENESPQDHPKGVDELTKP
jgi:sporulation protein YlmC with PRC-barrel domain